MPDVPENPWRIRLSCPTELRVPVPIEFVLGALRVRAHQITDVTQPFSWLTFPAQNVAQPIGLGFDVRTPSGNYMKAYRDAGIACSAICRLLAVVHRCSVSQPRFDGMIDLAAHDGPRMLIQCVHAVDRPLFRTPQFDTALMTEFFEHWKAIADPSTNQQLDRAMFHLQASYESDDALTQFLELWVGIASLNRLLVGGFKIAPIPVNCQKCGKPTLLCTSCGEQHRQEHRENAVVRGIILDHMQRSRDDWNRVNDMRQRITHGGGPPSQDEALSAAGILREALARAITIALGLPSAWGEVLALPRARIRGDDDLWILARLDELPLAEVEASESIPEFRIARGGILMTPKPHGERLPVPFAMYGYRGSYVVVDYSAQLGSTLLDEIQPSFVMGGAPGEGSYH